MFIDFTALKQSLTIEQVVTMLGLQMKQAGNQLRGNCPACKTTGERELVVTPSKGAFYCFADKRGGDLIALAAHIRGESIKDAAIFLAEFNVQATVKVPSNVTITSSQESGQRKSFDRAKYQGGLDREHELLKDVSPELIARADLGVSNRGTHKGLISIPLYDKDTGAFLCYAGVPSIHVPKLKLSSDPLPANVVRLKA